MQFYDWLYSEQFSLQPKLDGLSFHSIDVDERAWLERAFEESEVLLVVIDLKGDKASGPNGFSVAFAPKVLGGFERGHRGGFLGVSYPRKV